ncbi:hypothetical protein Cpir12675_006296 [Ceratocystis pirilliformis]|uniref:FAD-binding PCMH-type domain-containing protein n=1 Tax=Ceratocystis pirilliformis TaxID=259994 RepID=A0ABR3YIG0_9PEZI
MTRFYTILGSALLLSRGSHAATSAITSADSCTTTTPKAQTTGSSAGDAGNNTDACSALASIVPNGVVLPSSDAYANSANYWATGPASSKPDCFVIPSTGAQVGEIVKLLIKKSTPFTVKGGGHTPYAGASSRDGGVVISMESMAGVQLSHDRSTVVVGPGARWIDVSRSLDPEGLSVVGGRIGDVGVSGLLLGGGLSFFSGKLGFACDNVKEYEVVLASGQVVVASPDSYQDLFWALRGGGGQNFGIVTSFRLRTVKTPGLWSNRNYIAGEPLIQQSISAFASLPPVLKEDTDAHAYLALVDAPGIGILATPSLFHPAPLQDNKWPATFAAFEKIPGLFNETVAGNISTIIGPTTPAPGSFQLWQTLTVKASSVDVLQDFYKIFVEMASETHAQLDAAAMPTIIFHTLTTKTLSLTGQNGGNPLGLSAASGPLWIIQVNLQWSDASKTEAAIEIAQKTLAKAQDAAKTRGVFESYEFMNYAYKTQDVLASYGSFNQAKLKMISEKYAFGGAINKLWTGHYQI